MLTRSPAYRFEGKDVKKKKKASIDESFLDDFDFVLHEPILRSGLRQFMAENYCEEGLIFWKDVEVFRDTSLGEQRRRLAEEMWANYFLPSSKREINVSFGTKQLIRHALLSKEYPSKNLFDTAQREIYLTMKQDSFSKFMFDKAFRQSKQLFSEICMSFFEPEESKKDDLALTGTDWQLLLAVAQVVNLKKGEILFDQGTICDEIFRLKSGQLLVEKLANGQIIRESVIDTAGTVFGEMFAVGAVPTCTRVVSACASEVYVLNHSKLRRTLFVSHSNLALRFYRSIAKRLATFLCRLSSVNKKNPIHHQPTEEEDTLLSQQNNLKDVSRMFALPLPCHVLKGLK